MPGIIRIISIWIYLFIVLDKIIQRLLPLLFLQEGYVPGRACGIQIALFFFQCGGLPLTLIVFWRLRARVKGSKAQGARRRGSGQANILITKE